jgi:flagellar biogenesis protein FliO
MEEALMSAPVKVVLIALAIMLAFIVFSMWLLPG